MIKKCGLGLLLVFNTLTSYSQNKPLIGSLLSDRVQQQANAMGQAFLKGDYQTFAKYTYPALLSAMGGESRMAATLTQTVHDMQTKGMPIQARESGPGQRGGLLVPR